MENSRGLVSRHRRPMFRQTACKACLRSTGRPRVGTLQHRPFVAKRRAFRDPRPLKQSKSARRTDREHRPAGRRPCGEPQIRDQKMGHCTEQKECPLWTSWSRISPRRRVISSLTEFRRRHHLLKMAASGKSASAAGPACPVPRTQSMPCSEYLQNERPARLVLE